MLLGASSLASLHPLPPGVNPDLVEERARPCQFSQVELTHLIDGGRCEMKHSKLKFTFFDGGRERTEERKRLEAIFLDSKEVKKIPSEMGVAPLHNPFDP